MDDNQGGPSHGSDGDGYFGERVAAEYEAGAAEMTATTPRRRR
ncbi:hypothetical protein [Streptomyces rhizoryzae]|nr:hypothetical protein [Streptomyces rhizoryzae]